MTLENSLLLHLRSIFQLALLCRPRAIDRLLYSLQEVDDFVVHKVLVDLHLLLKVSHLALVHQLEDPRAGLLDRLHIGLLQVEHLLPYLGLELPVGLIVYGLPLQVQQVRLRLYEFEAFEVAGEEGGEVVEFVRLVLQAQAIDADALVAIEAEELELLAVEAAEDWDGLRGAASADCRLVDAAEGGDELLLGELRAGILCELLLLVLQDLVLENLREGLVVWIGAQAHLLHLVVDVHVEGVDAARLLKILQSSLARNVAVGSHVVSDGALVHCLLLLRHLKLVQYVLIELILNLVVHADDARVGGVPAAAPSS